jgi:hypothetical protein
MYDCSKDMTAFHNEKVTLPGDDRVEMRERRNNGRTRLDKGLERDGHELPNCHSQGSYAMHTMVQDDASDYDIDDGAYFSHKALQDNGRDLTPAEAKERVRAALTQDNRLAYEAEIHHNCVRQPYPAGYHIDIPVYRINKDSNGTGSGETYELAASDGWTPSDAREVTRWFKKAVKDAGEHGRQLRWLTRLTKSFARSRTEWKKDTGSGITLTRLVVDAFKAVAGRDDEALRNTWQAISDRLEKSLVVEHPVNDGNLADDDDDKVAFFRDRLAEALETLKVLDDNPTRGEARKAWDEVFNTTFFSRQPTTTTGSSGDSGDGSGKRFKVDETARDKREDGGGMYG